jgi:hypothetical protein
MAEILEETSEAILCLRERRAQLHGLPVGHNSRGGSIHAFKCEAKPPESFCKAGIIRHAMLERRNGFNELATLQAG